MDPASITGVVGFALPSAELIYKYVSGVKGASTCILQLQEELKRVKASLQKLQSFIITIGANPSQASAIFAAAYGCKRELEVV